METRAYNHYRRLPPEFVAALNEEWPADTINGLLLAARVKGWSLRTMGDALGVTGESIRLRSVKANPHYALTRMDEVPDVPAPPPLPPKVIPMSKQDIPEPEASTLRRLNDIARTVNGTATADDPRRAASVELSHRFATLLDAGYSPGRIARAAGVTRAAVMMRVRRHGYFPMWNSMTGDNYLGRAWWEEMP